MPLTDLDGDALLAAVMALAARICDIGARLCVQASQDEDGVRTEIVLTAHMGFLVGAMDVCLDAKRAIESGDVASARAALEGLDRIVPYLDDVTAKFGGS